MYFIIRIKNTICITFFRDKLLLIYIKTLSSIKYNVFLIILSNSNIIAYDNFEK